MRPTQRTNTNGSSRTKPTLEIVPDSRFIVFNGGEHEASPVILKGVVRLTTPESISILKPKIQLEGKRKISWWYSGGLAAGEIADKRTFWTQEQKLGGVESAHKIKAGTIEWPFEFELSPSMPESVEGLKETFIAYQLCASVSRPGWNSKDLGAQEHIRIVRTLGQDSMEMTRSRVNADIWANKISYSISIPTDAIVFGTSITADVELSPIKKGLRMGKVELRLLETVVKRIQISELPDRGDRTKSDETEVAATDFEFPEHTRVMYEDETIDNPTLADEMYRFKATLPLPRSLNKCRQDVDSHQINVTHRFKLMVNIHNPEGHVSQLVCRLPVKLFISPNLPVDESNEVCATANGVSHAALNSTETTVVAPPEYGRHQLDQLFSDIDPAGYMSRAPSDHGSPSGAEAQSRRGSVDRSPTIHGVLNGVTNDDNLDDFGSASPAILHSRLTDLQAREIALPRRSPAVSFSNSPTGGGSPAPGRADGSENQFGSNVSQSGTYFPSNLRETPHRSATGSRRPSDDEDSSAVRQHDYDMDNLMRVPSYGAALRTSGTITPFTDVPPSYVEATSRPPSPLQRPSQAHVRADVDSPISPGIRNNLTNGLDALSMTAQPSAAIRAPRSRGGSLAADDDARLRMLRART